MGDRCDKGREVVRSGAVEVGLYGCWSECRCEGE